ncbi:DUF2528 family protein [Acidovorax temperans]|uniref:DUF2528 family protein n=1 Tax=Acidovorax temperans TaxID=80878 RepID=UPI0006970403|nr:DUF2528 family protein [Acidovorax temperans]
MSNVKTYKVVAASFDDAEVNLQVDHDVLTPDLATLINTFWSGAEDRLAQENGDVVRAVVRLFGSCAISFFMSDGGAQTGGGDCRYWTQRVIKAQHEGWPDVDSLGILLAAVFVGSVSYDEVSLEGGDA